MDETQFGQIGSIIEQIEKLNQNLGNINLNLSNLLHVIREQMKSMNEKLYKIEQAIKEQD